MKTASSILAMAAALALGTSVMAQQSPASPNRDDNARQDERPSGVSPGNTTSNMGGTPSETGNPGGGTAGNRDRATTPDRTTGAMTGAAAAGASQADQAISQQLQQIRSSPDTAPDKLFVLHNATGNLFEVRFAELAERKSQDNQVKELARMIREDHQRANQRLSEVARGMNMTVPTELPAMKQQELAIFEQLPAQDFDKAYIAHMKAGHAKDITQFSDKQQTAKNDQLKAYVSETLPKLKQHGQHVVQVAQAKGLQGDMTVVSAGGAGGDMNRTGTGATAGDRDRGPTNQKANEDARTGIPAPNNQPLTGERRE